MKEWHLKHMQETIIKYIEGLSEDTSRYEKKLYKRYYGLNNVYRRIEYDLKHGVTNNELVLFLRMIKIEPSYLDLRKSDGALNRLNDIEVHFSQSVN